MDGLTVIQGNRFLETGKLQEAGSLSQTERKAGIESSQAKGSESFADTLKQAIESVNSLQKGSDKAMQDLAAGRTDNVAEVMIAAEKADVALRVMMQVRNKIIDAYQEVMKMQV